jgi:hypothetical protein
MRGELWDWVGSKLGEVAIATLVLEWEKLGEGIGEGGEQSKESGMEPLACTINVLRS